MVFSTHSLRTRGTSHCPPVVVGLAALLLASPAVGQSITLGEHGITEVSDLGRAFQTFSVFGGTPGIAAAQYYSDFRLNNYQLPIAHAFEPIAGGVLAGVAPYAEITVDYLTANRTFPLEGGGVGPNSVRLSFTSWSALAGAGLEIPLTPDVKLRPIFLAGYAHIGADAEFSS